MTDVASTRATSSRTQLRALVIGALVAAACVISAWAGGLLWFASTLPAAVEDPTTHTDAIVVLTGGSERIETGFKLLSAGLADKLFVSGVGGQVKAGSLVARSDALPPELAGKVAVGSSAYDTPGNATETAVWAHAEHISSIRLVTAGYHMRRSLLEFHAAMPDVRIVPHAVFPAVVKTDWWRWPGTASLIAREYTKFVLSWARQNLGLAPRAAARENAQVTPRDGAHLTTPRDAHA